MEDVFKKSGVPTHTFVEPSEFNRVVVALRTPGRGLIVEGPSGIGKTSCIRRAVERLQYGDSCTWLSARRSADVARIAGLKGQSNVGLVIIDDFHRLPDELKLQLTDLMKLAADEEDVGTKIVLIGINRAGQSLIDVAPDLLHRIEIIRLARTNIERLIELINRGQYALNCEIAAWEDIAGEAEGSFAMAQILCHEACLQAGVIERCQGTVTIETSVPAMREAVIRELSARFTPVARDFATGNRLRREGRAPYLHLLRWLSTTEQGVLDTRDAIAANPKMKGSVSQVIEKGHLRTLISNNTEIGNLIHFDAQSQLLTAEDPKFLYFIRHLIWSNFSRQIGYFNLDFTSKYDFALSFAGENREIAERLCEKLMEREIQVFYDMHEQHRIVANDVEEYLAPIYRAEARYVVAILSKDYPRKIWTKFESGEFAERYGSNVISIVCSDWVPGAIDPVSAIGYLSYDLNGDREAQIEHIADVIAAKLTSDRTEELAAAAKEAENAANDLFYDGSK
ncbi:TIR domain-containing protein [Cupriavidus nantongensis]|uniref:TIR domain-containing protein n=1 Tax=Cupriavidus nantongensis TaxID=1796606 RepID=UPI00358F5AA5